MAEDIQGLIEKINQEGIQKAEIKAAEIEAQAKKTAEGIVLKAQKEAENMLAEAKKEIANAQAKSQSLLKQAGRDFLLLLREEINAMLSRTILAELKQALSRERLQEIILELIRAQKATGEIIITLKKEDAEALSQGLLAKLKDELRHKVSLKAGQDIHAGFTISFDSGKSYFDFTDKALADYIGAYLKPRLNQLLQESLDEK